MRSSFLATVVQSSYALSVRHASGADEQPFDMAFTALCATAMLLGAIAADAPVPRTTWEQQETHLKLFQESGVFNYSILLLSEETDVLYIGAREAIFAVNALNVSEKQHEVTWGVNEDKQKECSKKGKSIQTECLNYVRVLQALNSSVLYVCGTNAFQPTCSYLSISPFQMVAGRSDDGKGRSPFDPAHSYTSVMVDGELYSGTSFTFLGGEPIILRHSQNGQLRTEYAVPWLNEPRFVFSDVIREYPSGHGDDDKVYFFFTEVSVEYEFVNKLLIPRIARVCKNDYGGLRTLQKKWTSFLKAKLICSIPEKNLVFNIVNDVFILKPPRPAEPVIYGIFTSQLNNVGVSAVCAYNISTVEDVFTKGKYMHSTTVESHTKWVQYNGNVPSPRPGACINAQARAMNFSTSLDLPDKTLQFVKDHPLMNDLVTPVGNKPKLVKHNVKYTQIVVDRVKALDNNLHDVMFISTDKGTLHKAVNYANEMFIIEEIELFPKSEPVQTLILSSKEGKKLIYAGSNIGVVQSPLAFCEKYSSCVDCVLARDPYCAWQQETSSCIHLPASSGIGSELIQKLNGDASSCPNKSKGVDRRHMLNLGSSLKLKCSQKSNLATVFWKFKGDRIKAEGPKYYLLGEDLFIFNITEDDIGDYQCLSEEDVRNVKYSQVLAKHILDLKKVPQTTTTVGPTRAAAQTEGNDTPNMSTMGTEVSATQTSTSQTVTPSTTTSTVLTNPTSHVLMSTASLTNIFSADPDISLKKTLYLTKANDTPLFTYLFVLFFVLFMCLLTYNCYKGFLPEHCLKYRSAMLPGKEKVVSDFVDCEPGLKETLVEQPSTQTQSGEQPKASRDTGYETDPECGNGKIPHAHETQTIEEDDSEKPFDVNCELKFADSDVEGD